MEIKPDYHWKYTKALNFTSNHLDGSNDFAWPYSCRQPFVRVGFAIRGDVNVGWLRNCIVIIIISSISSNTEHAVSPPSLERVPATQKGGY